MHPLDLESITTEYHETIARLAPTHRELAHRVLRRVPPARWQLEWYLPYWLGDAFRLDEKIVRQFVLSNVLGLVSIRLQDDLQDGEFETPARAAIELAGILQRAALEIYQPHFLQNTSFWERVETILGEWRTASRRVNSLALSHSRILRDHTDPRTQTLAQLGAPLKIPALAICELTAHQQNFVTLARVLDHLLLANVLYDHAMDCDADLRAGRWNLFVASLSELPQNAPNQNRHRTRLAEAWMTNTLPRAYFQEIEFHIRQARRLNRALHVAGLDAFSAKFTNDVRHTYSVVKQHYASHLERLTLELFRKSPNPTSMHARSSYGNPGTNPKTHVQSHL